MTFAKRVASQGDEIDRGLWLLRILERLPYLWIEQRAFDQWQVTTTWDERRIEFHGTSLSDALAQMAQWALLDVPAPDDPIRLVPTELP